MGALEEKSEDQQSSETLSEGGESLNSVSRQPIQQAVELWPAEQQQSNNITNKQ